MFGEKFINDKIRLVIRKNFILRNVFQYQEFAYKYIYIAIYF